MFNIHYGGNYSEEHQLIQGKALPEKAVQLKEANSIAEAFKSGTLLCLPIILPAIGIAVFRLIGLNKQLETGISLVAAALITLAFSWLLIFLHEFIHALLYPLKAEKSIWRAPQSGAYFVYCTAETSKARFIVICLAPTVILGIIPFIVWYFIAPYLPMHWAICIMAQTLMQVMSGVGDLSNAYNVIRQVPKDALVFNYGFHSFWRNK